MLEAIVYILGSHRAFYRSGAISLGRVANSHSQPCKTPCFRTPHIHLSKQKDPAAKRSLAKFSMIKKVLTLAGFSVTSDTIRAQHPTNRYNNMGSFASSDEDSRALRNMADKDFKIMH